MHNTKPTMMIPNHLLKGIYRQRYREGLPKNGCCPLAV